MRTVRGTATFAALLTLLAMGSVQAETTPCDLLMGGTYDAATGTCYLTFGQNKSVTLDVPGGIDTLDVYLQGGSGGGAFANSNHGYGGQGGRVRGRVGVTPGQQLHIVTGYMDAFSGGSGGGYSGCSRGGGGGRASGVFDGNRARSNEALLVAGGGGGAAGSQHCKHNFASNGGHSFNNRTNISWRSIGSRGGGGRGGSFDTATNGGGTGGGGAGGGAGGRGGTSGSRSTAGGGGGSAYRDGRVAAYAFGRGNNFKDVAGNTPWASIRYDAGVSVLSLVRGDANPTNASRVRFDVTFSEAVGGVDADAFVPTGDVGGSIVGVAGDGASYEVTVDLDAGDEGVAGLRVRADAGITSLATNLGLVADHDTGETYDVDVTPPHVEDGSIAVTGASSADGFAVGDALTLTWDDAASGEAFGYARIAVDLAEVEGPSDAAAVSSSDGWTTTYDVPAGDDAWRDAALHVTVEDAAGNVTDVPSAVLVNVDGIVPEVRPTALQIAGGTGPGGGYQVGDQVSVTWAAAAEGAGVHAVHADLSAFGQGADVALVSTSDTTWTGTWEVTQTVDATVDVEVRATRPSGNEGTATVPVRVASLDDSVVRVAAPAAVSTEHPEAFISVELRDARGGAMGASAGTVELTTDRGTLGEVEDRGDGRYTAVLTAAPEAGGGTATIAATLDGAPIDATATVRVDFAAPVVSAGDVTVTGATGPDGRYRIGDVLTITWNDPEAGGANADVEAVTVDASALGGADDVAATAAGSTWTAAYTVANTGVAGDALRIGLRVRDGSGNVATASRVAELAVDAAAPVVTRENLRTSGGTGTNGAFRAGDVVTATWRAGATGDGNVDVSSVTLDFGAVGGPTSAPATQDGDTWRAAWTLPDPLAVDRSDATIGLTADDAAGNVTTFSSSPFEVDGVAPTVTSAALTVQGASAAGGVFKVGDVVEVRWDDGPSGDANADTIAGVEVDFGAFGGPERRTATREGDAWVATHPLGVGTLSATDLAVGVHVRDDAGNTASAATPEAIAAYTVAPSTPTPVVLGPGDGSTGSARVREGDAPVLATADVRPTLAGRVDPGTTVTLFVDGVAHTTFAPDADGAWDYTFPDAFEDGAYEVQIAATAPGIANTSPPSEPVRLLIDTKPPDAPPVPSVVAPSGTDVRPEAGDARYVTSDPNQTISGSGEVEADVVLYVRPAMGAAAEPASARAVATRAAAASPPTAPSTSAAANDGWSEVGDAPIDPEGSWTFAFPDGGLREGDNDVAAVVRDAAGNLSPMSGSIVVHLDTARPTLALRTPAEGDGAVAVPTQATLPVSGTSVGLADGAVVRIVADDATQRVEAEAVVENDAWQATVDLTPLDDGPLTLRATATDRAGNAAEPRTLELVKDVVRPTVRLEGPEGVEGAFEVTVVFSEAVHGFEAADVAIEAAAVAEVRAADGGTTYRLSIDDVELGERVTIAVPEGVAHDSAGNASHASDVLEIRTGSPASAFEAHRDTVEAWLDEAARDDLERTVAAASARLDPRHWAVPGGASAQACAAAGASRTDADPGGCSGPSVDVWSAGEVRGGGADAEGRVRVRVPRGPAGRAWRVAAGYAVDTFAEDAVAAADVEVGWTRTSLATSSAARFGVAWRADVRARERRDDALAGASTTMGASLMTYATRRPWPGVEVRGLALVRANRVGLDVADDEVRLLAVARGTTAVVALQVEGRAPLEGARFVPRAEIAAGRTWPGAAQVDAEAYGRRTSGLVADVDGAWMASWVMRPHWTSAPFGVGTDRATWQVSAAPGVACRWSDVPSAAPRLPCEPDLEVSLTRSREGSGGAWETNVTAALDGGGYGLTIATRGTFRGSVGP
ncbi:MAG: Ig-like domain-containing protein [Trueperaceae bacterium]|nr:Ig-like domain-containing protein [Trueperaceae bacterium]